MTGAPGLAARHPERHRGLEQDLDEEVLRGVGREHGARGGGVSRQGQGPGHHPDLAEAMELVCGLLTDSQGRGAEEGVDDEVGDTRQVVESRDEILTERETSDEQLQSLPRDLTVDARDVGLLGAEAGV